MTKHCSGALRCLQDQEVEIRNQEFDLDVIVSLRDLYTADACDELAVALVGLIDCGEVIQVKTSGEWPGGYLLHAGVRLDGQVYDIDGVHDIDEWINRWGRGMDFEVLVLSRSSDQQVFRSDASRRIAVDTACRLLEVPEYECVRKPSFQL